MTPLRLNKAHFPVTVLGPGRRVGIWFQGCSIGCPGCVSQDTWSHDGGGQTTVEAILGWCVSTFDKSGFDGITISGGEPFEQVQALMTLLRGLNAWRTANNLDFDILCYSGLPLKKLREHHGEILPLLDVLIAEPYVNKFQKSLTWRGSSNQPLVSLSERGQTIVERVPEIPADKRFQLNVCDGSIWLIGIPERGDMQRLEALASQRGMTFGGVSWRA